MSATPSDPRRRLLTWILVGVFGALSGLRMLESGTVPWGTLLLATAAVGLLAGPVAWILRDRCSAERRERLRLVGFGIAMVLVPISFGLALAFEIPLVTSFDGVIVGMLVGALVVGIVERTVLPDRLRGAHA